MSQSPGKRQGAVGDQILAARALYLQLGVQGDTLGTALDNDAILIEVPEAGFDAKWASIYRSQLVKRFRLHGLSQSEAAEASSTYLSERRAFLGFRVRS